MSKKGQCVFQNGLSDFLFQHFQDKPLNVIWLLWDGAQRSCDGIPSDSMSRANCFCLWNVATPSKTTCLQEQRIFWLFFVSSWTLACCHNNHISHVACLVWSSQCWPLSWPRSAQGALLALCLPLLTSGSPDHLPIHQQAYGYHQIQVGPSWLHGNGDEVVGDHNYDVLLPVLYQPCQYHPARGPRSSRIHLPRISRPLQVPHATPLQTKPILPFEIQPLEIHIKHPCNNYYIECRQSKPDQTQQNLPYRTNQIKAMTLIKAAKKPTPNPSNPTISTLSHPT